MDLVDKILSCSPLLVLIQATDHYLTGSVTLAERGDVEMRECTESETEEGTETGEGRKCLFEDRLTLKKGVLLPREAREAMGTAYLSPLNLVDNL